MPNAIITLRGDLVAISERSYEAFTRQDGSQQAAGVKVTAWIAPSPTDDPIGIRVQPGSVAHYDLQACQRFAPVDVACELRAYGSKIEHYARSVSAAVAV